MNELNDGMTTIDRLRIALIGFGNLSDDELLTLEANLHTYADKVRMILNVRIARADDEAAR